MHLIAAFVAVAIVAGALGFGFRGAIAREMKVSKSEAETWAKQLETGAIAQIRAVASEIRLKLSKL